MKTKLIAWDVYGTLIATGNDEVRDDMDEEPLISRQGALECLLYARSKNITQVTCSDGDLGNLKRNLKKAGIIKNYFNEFFYDLFKMKPLIQKDFSYIREACNLQFPQILVIGDNYEIDIALAKKQGCRTLWVPEPGEISLEKLKDFI